MLSKKSGIRTQKNKRNTLRENITSGIRKQKKQEEHGHDRERKTEGTMKESGSRNKKGKEKRTKTIKNFMTQF
jgi:hypothetical protein